MRLQRHERPMVVWLVAIKVKMAVETMALSTTIMKATIMTMVQTIIKRPIAALASLAL